MKPHLLGAAFLACSAIASQAALFTFDSNETVNVSQGALPTELTIAFGVNVDVYDDEWNLIGTRWEIDPDPIDPITETPFNTGYGSSTTDSALFGIWQPILIVFSDSINIDAFSVFLDESTWGNPFPTPIWFFDAEGNLVESIDTLPDVPNFEAVGGGINGVKSILLPSGAMYDNMTIEGSLVPEPTAALLGGIGALGLFIRRKRP